MTLPIYRPFVFLRCDKCDRKTDHVLIDITSTSQKGEIEETYECQECGETKKVYELASERRSIFSVREGEVAVVTYTSAVDKMKLFSDFIREGLENGDWVDYTYPDEEKEIVRAKLKEYGIDVEKYEKNGSLSLRSLTEEYLPHGHLDREKAIKNGLERRAKAKDKGYKHVRELEDVGNFSFINNQWQTYIDLWDDPRWQTPSGAPDTEILSYSPFMMELVAFNVEGMNDEQLAEILKTFWERKPSSTLFIDTQAYSVATTQLQEFIKQYSSKRRFVRAKT